jgi:hypothetical protein
MLQPCLLKNQQQLPQSSYIEGSASKYQDDKS